MRSKRFSYYKKGNRKSRKNNKKSRKRYQRGGSNNEDKEYCETDVCSEYAINGKKFCSECLDNTNDDNDGGGGGRFP